MHGFTTSNSIQTGNKTEMLQKEKEYLNGNYTPFEDRQEIRKWVAVYKLYMYRHVYV